MAAGIVIIALMTAAFIIGAVLAPESIGTGKRGNDVPTAEDGNVSTPATTSPRNNSHPVNESQTNQNDPSESDPTSPNDSNVTQGREDNADWESNDGDSAEHDDTMLGGGSSMVAVVLINEVEADPPGDEEHDRSVHEWIELYNPTDSSIDLNGWKVKTTTGRIGTADLSGIIGSKQLLVVTFDKQVIDNDGDDTVQLFDRQGHRIDGVNIPNEKDDDGKTWQRVPDGGDTWAFQTGTMGSSNQRVGVPPSSPQPVTSDSKTPEVGPASDPQTTAPNSNMPPVVPGAPQTTPPNSSTGANETL